MGRPVVHFEIGCKDKKKTADFYAQLFDWNISEQGPAAMIAPAPTELPVTSRRSVMSLITTPFLRGRG